MLKQLIKICILTAIAGLVAFAVKAQPVPPPDPVFMQNMVGAMQAQRNAAQDQAAVAEARLAVAQARIAELEKQLAAAAKPKENGQ